MAPHPVCQVIHLIYNVLENFKIKNSVTDIYLISSHTDCYHAN